jgi:hypothetical protein
MNETEKRIKIEKNLDVTELDGEKVMIDFESGKYFMIKGSGNDIWDMMRDGIKISEIIDALLKEYDVDRETCEKSVVAFIKQMENYKFIALYE